MNQQLKSRSYPVFACAAILCWHAAAARDASVVSGSIQGKGESAATYSDGDYSIASPGIPGAVFRSDVEADVDSACCGQLRTRRTS